MVTTGPSAVTAPTRSSIQSLRYPPPANVHTRGYLPTNNLRADPNALYYLSGGGNDFLQGRVQSGAQANAAADRLANSVQVLQTAGARYIMVWLLPDLGLTPAINGTPLQGLHLATERGHSTSNWSLDWRASMPKSSR